MSRDSSAALAAATPLSSFDARSVVLEHLPDIRIETGVAKPLIVSEFGAGALAGYRAPEAELAVFSEEYQALVYRRQIEMLKRQPDLVGMSPWVLKDFRSALRLHPVYQQFYNRKGLVSDRGDSLGHHAQLVVAVGQPACVELESRILFRASDRCSVHEVDIQDG